MIPVTWNTARYAGRTQELYTSSLLTLYRSSPRSAKEQHEYTDSGGEDCDYHVRNEINMIKDRIGGGGWCSATASMPHDPAPSESLDSRG